MSKYNYFDDDYEYASAPSGKGFSLSGIKSKADEVVSGVKHNETIAELNALPNLKHAILRLLAFFLFLVTIAVAILIFAHSINSSNKKLDTYRKDAAKVCTDYIIKYGAVRWEALDAAKYGENKARLTGLCYARQMDFDDDGSDELMLCYYSGSDYMLEVWSYVDKKFSCVYSEEVNCTKNAKDGYWVGFYHKNNKYYICKSYKEAPEKVKLYQLKGDSFKTSGECDYDYKNDIYAVKGKINAQDFETIVLSGFRKSKGEVLAELVTANIDSFGNISRAVMDNQKSKTQLKKEAYYDIVKTRLEKYGDPAIKTADGYEYIDGVAIVRLIDFDSDGNEELFIAYRKEKKVTKYDYGMGQNIYYEVPVYSMEVYNWNGTVAKRIFSKDSISGFLENENAFYVVFTKGGKKTDICNNVYTFENSYYYKATSKIYRLKKDEKFDTVFSALVINDYGYKSYKLDGEYVYTSTFEQKGYRVPFFMDDNDTYDENAFEVIFVSGENAASYKDTVKQTVESIKSLNSEYSVTEK